MPSELLHVKKRKETRKKIEALYERSEYVLLIHYSCESFYDIKDGRTPRVTSIAVRNLKSAQTESFSIHKIAEREGVGIDKIPLQYDELEKKMLSDFFEFIRHRDTYDFIHWNMRDGNYGFSAIEHRFQVLGGEPYKIQDDKKFDLPRALVSLYGNQYVSHGSNGRFHSLIELNNITCRDFLTGREEAEAFESEEYIKLHQSTLRKVDCMSAIFERTVNKSLVTSAPWKDKYGTHPRVIIEQAKDNWVWSILVMIAILLGLYQTILQIIK